MELTQDEIIQKYSKLCPSCGRNAMLPYQYEFTCLPCGYNIKKLKINYLKFNEKDKHFEID